MTTKKRHEKEGGKGRREEKRREEEVFYDPYSGDIESGQDCVGHPVHGLHGVGVRFLLLGFRLRSWILDLG